jgi:hypothetical protein
MVTESIDKVKYVVGETGETKFIPDEKYLGYWEGNGVILPFTDVDVYFEVFNDAYDLTLSWVLIANGFALVHPVSILPLTN